MVSPRAVSICVSLSAKRLFGNQMFHCGPILAANLKRYCIGVKKPARFVKRRALHRIASRHAKIA
jgi:hypothetical protein